MAKTDKPNIVEKVTGKFMESFKDFPPIQHPNTFTIDDALKVLGKASGGGKH